MARIQRTEAQFIKELLSLEVWRPLNEGGISNKIVPSDGSVLLWMGGKSRLTAYIVPLFPEHSVYVEPFGGAASPLLAKKPSQVEIYNDIDKDLANMWELLQQPEDAHAVAEEIGRLGFDRSTFDQLNLDLADPRKPGGPDHHVKRAAWYFMRNRLSKFGTNGGSYNPDPDGKVPGRIDNILREFQALVERLRLVDIRCVDWRELMHFSQEPESLLFCDPPYHPGARTAGKYTDTSGAALELSAADHEDLLDHLMAAKGAVLISGYATPIDPTAPEPYKRLEVSGWARIDFPWHSNRGTKSSPRTESIWVNPVVVPHVLEQVPKLNAWADKKGRASHLRWSIGYQP
jgi:DNA adenine methylase